MDFFPMRVSDIRKETPDITSLSLKPLSGSKDKFRFTAGQFLIIRVQANGRDERRAYSICNSRNDDFLRIAIKHIEGGVFSKYVAETMKNEDILWALPPSGRFLGENKDLSNGEFLGVAVGSGITPVISVIREVLENSSTSRFTLFYGNRSANSIAFRSELSGLKNDFMSRFRVYHVLSRESGELDLFNGRIDEQRLDSLLIAFCPQDLDRAFICGPEEMMLASRRVLLRRGLAEAAIRIESFGSYDERPSTHKPERTTGSSIRITSGGRTSTVEMHEHDTSVLDAALAQGIELPFACKGGVCATCRCRIVSGTVAMDRNFALSQSELDDGMVLSCRAVPSSEFVELDFDV